MKNMQNVREWMEENERQFIEDILDLIKIPSVSIEEEGEMPFGKSCGNALEEILKITGRMGFAGENHENYCASILWKGEVEEEIGIFGHMDVVPEGNGWRYDPYCGTVEDGCIIGRGSHDDKGATMAAVYALNYLKESGWKPYHSIRVFFGANEEAGMKDLDYYLDRHPMPVFGLVPDVEFPVCFAEKGMMVADASCTLDGENLIEFYAGYVSNAVPDKAFAVLRLDSEKAEKYLYEAENITWENRDGNYIIWAKGVTGHAAFPENSMSAEVVLADYLRKAAVLNEKEIRLMEGIVSMFGDYNGKGLNIAFEDAISGKLTHVGGVFRTEGKIGKQNINIRYNIKADQNEIIKNMKEVLGKWGFRLDNVQVSPPCYVDKEDPVVKELVRIANQKLGEDLEPYTMGGGTYARKLKRAVAYGPTVPGFCSKFGTDRGDAHQPDEYAEIKNLETAVDIYVEAIKRVDILLKEKK